MTVPEEVREWWAANPMTYAARHGATTYEDGGYELGTLEFFRRVDEEFISWNQPLHNHAPFDRLFPFDRFLNARVLEVGCGMGTMAMLWAQRGAAVSAVDLNPVAVEQTTNRFALLGLDGDVRQADGRSLPFSDGAFDYAWSWGVLHHSPDLVQSVRELARVVRPGGRIALMLYHRRSFLHWYLTEYVEGFMHYERRFLDSVGLASRYGDAAREEGNPHTWPVTKAEVRAMLAPHCGDVTIRVLGTDLDGVLDAIAPRLSRATPVWAKKPWARRFGWSLWVTGTVT